MFLDLRVFRTVQSVSVLTGAVAFRRFHAWTLNPQLLPAFPIDALLVQVSVCTNKGLLLPTTGLDWPVAPLV